MPDPLRLTWEPRALKSLERVVPRNVRKAVLLVESLERLATLGWSTGRRTRKGGLRYFPVTTLGVFYCVQPGELVVVRVVDARRQEMP